MELENELKDRLYAVEQSGADTTARLGVVEDQLGKVVGKVDRILDMMSATIHRKEFNPAAVLTFVKDAAILIAMACASIIYFASQPGEADIDNRIKLAVMEYKLSQPASVDISQREQLAVMAYKLSIAEKQIGWKATTQ